MMRIFSLLSLFFAAATANRCTDFRNWEDKAGKGCDYYEQASHFCAGSTRWADRRGVSALDACCACNGGDQGSSSSCRDNENFFDSDGFNCEVYERNPLWCDYAEDYEKNGQDASTECCICNDGKQKDDQDIPKYGYIKHSDSGNFLEFDSGNLYLTDSTRFRTEFRFYSRGSNDYEIKVENENEYLRVTSRGFVTTGSSPEIFRIRSEGKGEFSLYHEDEDLFVSANSRDQLSTTDNYNRYSAWIFVDSSNDDDDALATH